MKVKHLNELVETLARGYVDQLAKYNEMLKLADLQTGAIEEPDMEKIKGILARRQELMKEIDRINAALDPVKEEIKQILHLKEVTLTNLKVVHTPAAETFRTTVEKLAEILRQINDIDVQNEEALVRKIGENKEERLRLNNAMKTTKAYSPQGKPAEPSFYDRKK